VRELRCFFLDGGEGGGKILRCLKIMELNWWKRVSPHDESLWNLKSLGVEIGEASWSLEILLKS